MNTIGKISLDQFLPGINKQLKEKVQAEASA